MCPRCQGFSEREKISHPHELYRLVCQLEAVLAEGTLTFAAGNCKLSDIREGKAWPEDNIEQTFMCVACAQKFRLAVETYHGSGGEWSPV
jgi:hypothetical protein